MGGDDQSRPELSHQTESLHVRRVYPAVAIVELHHREIHPAKRGPLFRRERWLADVAKMGDAETVHEHDEDVVCPDSLRHRTALVVCGRNALADHDIGRLDLTGLREDLLTRKGSDETPVEVVGVPMGGERDLRFSVRSELRRAADVDEHAGPLGADQLDLAVLLVTRDGTTEAMIEAPSKIPTKTMVTILFFLSFALLCPFGARMPIGTLPHARRWQAMAARATAETAEG